MLSLLNKEFYPQYGIEAPRLRLRLTVVTMLHRGHLTSMKPVVAVVLSNRRCLHFGQRTAIRIAILTSEAFAIPGPPHRC